MVVVISLLPEEDEEGHARFCQTGQGFSKVFFDPIALNNDQRKPKKIKGEKKTQGSNPGLAPHEEFFRLIGRRFIRCVVSRRWCFTLCSIAMASILARGGGGSKFYRGVLIACSCCTTTTASSSSSCCCCCCCCCCCHCHGNRRAQYCISGNSSTLINSIMYQYLRLVLMEYYGKLKRQRVDPNVLTSNFHQAFRKETTHTVLVLVVTQID